jgi:hypothetical protein
VFCEPRACFFHAVAVGDAVNGQGCFSHGAESCRKRDSPKRWATIAA